tara:strand:+ start:116 stop:517 length:402 start_codon:yes stop_codon:yes gene_type:complete
MITFILEIDEAKKKYEFPLSETIISIKGKIIEDNNLKCKYIDIDFLLDRPIRTLGNFNLEPGILPRTFDIYPLERFGGIDERTITIRIIEIKDYTPSRVRRDKINLHKYSTEEKSEQEKYNLNSEEDFPKLGL